MFNCKFWTPRTRCLLRALITRRVTNGMVKMTSTRAYVCIQVCLREKIVYSLNLPLAALSLRCSRQECDMVRARQLAIGRLHSQSFRECVLSLHRRRWSSHLLPVYARGSTDTPFATAHGRTHVFRQHFAQIDLFNTIAVVGDNNRDNWQQ